MCKNNTNAEWRRLNTTHTTYLSIAQLSVPKCFGYFCFIVLFLVILSNTTSKIHNVAIFVIDEHIFHT